MRLDGTPVNVEVMATLLMYRGRPAVQVIVTDITDRKQTAEALRQSEERLRLALSMAHMGYWQYEVTSGILQS